MIAEDADRVIVYCNKCPVRLDLGKIGPVRTRNRMPSGWLNAGGGRHYCPACAPRINFGALLAMQPLRNPQPLV